MSTYQNIHLSLTNEAHAQLAEIRAALRGALGTNMSRSKVVVAAVEQMHKRVLAASESAGA